jgi:predicted transcriptional regulator
MFKAEILENENRRKIYLLIEANPGIHFRELQRNLNIPLTTLDYHLNYMVRKKIVFGEKEAQFRRYYTKPLDREDKKVLSALRQKKLREIVLVVTANQKAKYQFLSEYLKLPYSTLSFYLKYLVEKGILEREKIGNETFYTVKDEDRVTKILIAYRTSFLDKLIDKALSTWLESYSGKEEL